MAADPLPSWNEGPAKQALISFVTRVTDRASPDYVEPADRIATFDNDGTLWSEQPAYFQLLFAVDRVRALAPKHPEWKTQQPFKGVLEGDLAAAAAGGERAIAELLVATHAGMTTDEFTRIVESWIATARHPRFKRAYSELTFQPMHEVLAYLRSQGFETYIVSGGGVEFMRAWVQQVYGIPPQRVIGSSGKLKYEMRPEGPVLVRLGEVDFIDDGPGKPAGIQKFIGRRPLMAFGNSDGDLQMLQWTTSAPGARFALLVHHTDAEREYAYDRASRVGKLDKAWDEAKTRGWTVVDMKKDWKQIYRAPSARE